MGQRARAGVLIASVALIGAAGACSLFVSLDGLDDGPSPSADGGGDELSTADVTQPSEAAPGDAAMAMDADDGADAGPCGNKPGPAMVAVSNYCIDGTEVTNKQYADFLDAIGLGLVPSQPASLCAWNTGFIPDTVDNGCSATASDPVTRPNYPIACVDWCDAYAYCAWAGKRLCGSTDGGGVDFGNPNIPSSQWGRACTANGTRIYPYGNAYEFGACNTPDVDSGGTKPVGSMPGCVGGYAGIYDLAGNIEEWGDSCQYANEGGANDPCHEFGDAVDYSSQGPAKCAQTDYDTRNGKFPDVGFRCCSP